MKKWLFILFLIVALGVSFWGSYDSSRTTQKIEQSWLLGSQKLQKIEIYGSE